WQGPGLRAPALAGLHRLAVRRQLHECARAGRPERPGRRPDRRELHGRRLPVQGHQAGDRAARERADLAAALRPRRQAALRCAPEHRDHGRKLRRAHVLLPDQDRRPSGAGDDVQGPGIEPEPLMLIRAFLLSLVLAVVAPASAHATGFFGFSGTSVTYRVDSDEPSNISIFATPPHLRLVTFSGSVGPDPGCTFVGNGTGAADTNAVDCPLQGVSRIVLLLGNGNDVASVAQNVTIPVTFDGGGGND